MSDQEYINKIDEIHSQYENEMAVLQCEKNALLAEFAGELEKIKMEELKNKLQQ